jgi:hypothetical protein
MAFSLPYVYHKQKSDLAISGKVASENVFLIPAVVNPLKLAKRMVALPQTRYRTGAPGRIRTCGARIRNPMLYPLSYGGVTLSGPDIRLNF